MTRVTVAQLPRPALVLVTDAAHMRGRAIEDVVSDAVLAGVNVVQLREKTCTHTALLGLGARVRDAIAGRALFSVNSDIDSAFVLRADCMHLPEGHASIDAARARLGSDALICCAVHSADAAQRAEQDGADIVQVGTVFPSQSHPGGPTLGLDGLRAICEAVSLPVVAIGGITASNAASVIDAGAAGVAVIGAILDPADTRLAAAELRRAIDEAFAART